MADPIDRRPYDDGEINLIDYWRVIWGHKWFIGILSLVSITAALIFSLLSPKIYQSVATIITPKEGGGSGLLSLLGASSLTQQISGSSIPSFTPNRDLFIGILKSRTIGEHLVRQFHLQDYYKKNHPEEAIQSLRSSTTISTSKEGVISVRVEDKDPKMAADIANAYIAQLDQLMTQFGTGSAGSQRRFITTQLAKAQKELITAEETLRQFQERNRAILLGDMSNSMRLPGAQVPKVGMEMLRLMRDLRVQEAIFTLLTQQLEQAKIAEAQDTPVVQVLDRAVPSIRKAKPTTVINMMVAGAVGFFLGIFLSFFREYLSRQRMLDAVRIDHS